MVADQKESAVSRQGVQPVDVDPGRIHQRRERICRREDGVLYRTHPALPINVNE